MAQSNHPLTWFEAREGKTIQRNGRAFKIPNKAAAPYCYQLQGEGFAFSDKLRITVMPESTCTSCEG